jgi:hypothetical protein
MNIDDATLMAYVDGELAPDAVAAVEAAVAADPALADRVGRLRMLRTRLRAAYAPVLDEPVPERLVAALSPASPVPRTPLPAPAARESPSSRRRLPRWLAMAASLVLGVMLAQWLPRPSPLPLDDDLVARGALARALEQQLAGEVAEVATGISFRGRDGRYCRTFQPGATTPGFAGLACRQPEGWRVEVLAASASGRSGELRTASSLPAAVLAELDARLEGEPLDAEGERAARDAGWR